MNISVLFMLIHLFLLLGMLPTLFKAGKPVASLICYSPVFFKANPNDNDWPEKLFCLTEVHVVLNYHLVLVAPRHC